MEYHYRKKIRLENYDYSRNGAYFITICTKDKAEYFWDYQRCVGANCVRPQGKIKLTEYGKIVKDELNQISSHYDNIVKITKYVIMPNHIHMIMIIDNFSEDYVVYGGRTQFAPTISRVIKQFKGSVTKQIGFSIWHKSFHDRIIRNDEEYAAYWRYIENNPINWENDELFLKGGN